jgi:hypothetical protein
MCVKVHGFRSKRFTKTDMKRVIAALERTDVFSRSRAAGVPRSVDGPLSRLEVWFKGKHALLRNDDIDTSFEPLLRSVEQDADLESWIGEPRRVGRFACEGDEQVIHGL